MSTALRASSYISRRPLSARPRLRCNSTAPRRPLAETDELGIPLRPTWSVNELLSSYPKPAIDAPTLRRLHELSALIPPEEGSAAHATLTAEMEDLVKLVEAVKLVHVDDAPSRAHGVPDGRVWAEDTGIELDTPDVATDASERSGRALLEHAARTEAGLYVVDATRFR